MLKDLKFVQGAVAKKDYQPALTHFRIKDGRVMGYNGTIALSSPIDLDLEATPQALPFVKAIERCGDTTTLSLTPTGKLFVKSGRFKAYVECIDESEVLDSIVPEGEEIDIESGFIPALRILSPFIGTDASRPWAMGILLRAHSAYATNNIILAEYWIGESMPDVNLPTSAINELTRIGEEPVKVQLGKNSITFFFEGDRWLRSQLLATDWPDISGLLDSVGEADPQPFPEGFFDSVEVVAPFVADEGRIYFREGKITTAPEGDAGASVAIEGLPDHGAYNLKMLRLLQESVIKIDFTTHPKPCPFNGTKLRGVFLGMREG